MRKIIAFMVLLGGVSSFAETSKDEEKKYYAGLSTTYAFFSSLAVDDLELDIDPKLLTSIEGSVKITKKLRGILNVNFDSAELDKTFQVFGALASKNMLLQITTGKFSGNASLTSEILSSPIRFSQETETKYLSADLLFRMDWEWLKGILDCKNTSCYHGLRFVSYQLPAEILTAGRFDFGSSTIEDAPLFLDPEFEVKGVMYTISVDTMRSFVLGETDVTGQLVDEKNKELEKTKSEKEEKGKELVQAPGSRFAGIGKMSLGYGRGTISDAGKKNISDTTGGKTVENESRDFVLFDATFAGYYTWSWQKKNARWLLGLGYLAQMNLTFDFDFSLGESAPDDTSVVRFDNAGIGYFFHGPSLAFYGTF